MENKVSIITETAWNLYRAFRTYPGPIKAIEDARAVVPERGRVYRYPVVYEDGIGDASNTYETTDQPTNQWLAGISHARAIVLSFNLAEPTTDKTYNIWGSHILTECIAHEIEQGTEATRQQCEDWYSGDETKDFIRYDDLRTPFIGRLDDSPTDTHMPPLFPYITLNLSVYENREDFINHANAVLPDVYDRLSRLVRVERDNYTKAFAKVEEKWLHPKLEATPDKITLLVREKGKDALLGHLNQEQWEEWERTKRDFRPNYNVDPYREMVIPRYEEAMPPVNPDSGLTKGEWEFYWYFCTLEPDGTCRVCLPPVFIGSAPLAAPLRQARGRYLSVERRRHLADFHRHTAWWAEVATKTKTRYGISRDEGIERTVVKRAIDRLEITFLLRDEGVQDRDPETPL